MTGTVDSIKTLPSQGRGGGGLHLILAAANGPIEVHVGPVAFVSSKNMTFAKGDAVTVLGSKVPLCERPPRRILRHRGLSHVFDSYHGFASRL